MKRRTLACAVGLAACATSAQAWHNQGHMMVAAVAWGQLSESAKCRALLLLSSDTEFSRGLDGFLDPGDLEPGQPLFINAATWPDRIKAAGSGFRSDGDDPDAPVAKDHNAENDGLPNDHWAHKYWHFADLAVPDNPSKPPPTINSAERIRTFRAKLADQDTPTGVKAYDLVWLLHLVGDIHQPLHNATQYGAVFKAFGGQDAGGNGVKVTYTGYQELHGFWDGTPGDAKGAGTLKAAVDALADLPAPAADKVAVINVDAWAKESHGLAKQYAYVSPIKTHKVGPFKLTPAYVSNAQIIARRQVALGGARLAKLLNDALTWPEPMCPDIPG
jgi:hypothetical protein